MLSLPRAQVQPGGGTKILRQAVKHQDSFLSPIAMFLYRQPQKECKELDAKTPLISVKYQFSVCGLQELLNYRFKRR